MALNGIKTLQARLERLERLLPPEPVPVMVEINRVSPEREQLGHVRLEGDTLVLRIAPHFTL